MKIIDNPNIYYKKTYTDQNIKAVNLIQNYFVNLCAIFIYKIL